MLQKNNLIIKTQYRKISQYSVNSVNGLDTETIEGKAILICDSNSRVLQVKRTKDLLDFLCYKGYRKSLNLFYNVDFDFGAIIKWLGLRRIDELAKYEKTTWSTKKAKYQIIWIKGKNFTIKKEKKSYIFYDLYNLCESSLEKASQLWLNKGKIAEGKNFEDLWANNRDFAIKYCLNDALLVKEIALKVIERLKSLDLEYYKWYSWGKISEYYFMKNCKIPTINSLDKQILLYFMESYKGNWVDMIKKGIFENIYEFDINSAYPSAIASLINPYHGFWSNNHKKMNECYYAVAKVTFDNSGFIPPITYKYKYNVNPQGKITSWLCLNELLMIQDKILKIHDFYGFIPYRKDYFMRKEIQKLYLLRDKNIFLKTILNSIYGKFVQRNNRGKTNEYTANLWNPIFASFITTHTRFKLYNFIKDNPQNIISINTDELFTKKPLNVGNSKKLGGFKSKLWKRAVFVANGVYYLENGTQKQAVRGFKKVDLKAEIANNLNNNCIVIKRNEALSIKLARVLTKYSYEDINKFIELERKIYVNHEFKRWYPEIKDYKELISGEFNSFPLHVNMLIK